MARLERLCEPLGDDAHVRRVRARGAHRRLPTTDPAARRRCVAGATLRRRFAGNDGDERRRAPESGACAWRTFAFVTSASSDSPTRAERADRDKTTVVIADDHTVVRQGLRMLIDADPEMQVVAEGGTIPDAERLTRAHRPTVLVLDLNMHGESRLDAMMGVLESTPDTSIVVLTMQ